MFELKKIGIVKRASAWLLDAILLTVLTTGFMYVISLICNYSGAEALARQYYDEWDGFRKEYIVVLADKYGFTYEESEDGDEYTITKDGQPSSMDDVLAALVGSEGKDAETAEAYNAYLALTPIKQVNRQAQYVLSLLFMMMSLGILLAYLVLEFIIPIILKNGQTVGKKVFGIGVIRPDCVKINNLALFARTILGKYAIETMFPVMLVVLFLYGMLGILALILLAAMFILNFVLLVATKNRTPIHDLLAVTVVVDMSLQMVYASEEELIEKKKQYEMERVAGSKG